MNISQKDEFRYIFAGLAMMGMVSRSGIKLLTKQIAHEAVIMADALIEEIDKKEVNNGQD
jgi:hypothetical protein